MWPLENARRLEFSITELPQYLQNRTIDTAPKPGLFCIALGAVSSSPSCRSAAPG
jgi:hypothetical protein